MKIAIVGAGGIGTHLIHMLVNTLTKDDELHVFDGDEFEEKNLRRQLFGRDMLATNKAEAMRIMYNKIIPIESHEVFITNERELEGFDYVFCVPDNNLARQISIRAADEYGMPLIVAGNERTSANAMYYLKGMFENEVISREVHPFNWHPEYEKDDAPRIAAHSCTAVVEEEPQTIVANSIAASLCMALFTAYNGYEPFPEEIACSVMPLEFEWGKTFLKKNTAFDMSRNGEEK